MDEAELSRRFPTGDEGCLEEVVARYGQALLRYCHHILCDYHEAQDAVHTALLRQRRRQRFAPPPPAAHDPDYIGPELREALGRLTAQERGLVFGRVMEGRPYSELAQIYGQPAATLRKRYERARGKLARALTELSDTEKEVSP